MSDEPAPGGPRRTLVVVVVLLLALTSTGFGLWNPVDQFVTGSELGNDGVAPVPTGDDPGAWGPEPPDANDDPSGTGGEPAGDSPAGATPGGDSGDTPTSSGTETDDDDESDGADRDGGVDLRVDAEGSVLFDVDGVVPGDEGTARARVANAGEDPGRLALAALTYESAENGQTDAEAAVDSTGGDPGVGAGELHEALRIRVAVVDDAGVRTYVVGDRDADRPLDAVAGESGVAALGRLGPGESRTLVVEWRVPAAVGNEIQSDRVTVDLGLRLVATD